MTTLVWKTFKVEPLMRLTGICLISDSWALFRCTTWWSLLDILSQVHTTPCKSVIWFKDLELVLLENIGWEITAVHLQHRPASMRASASRSQSLHVIHFLGDQVPNNSLCADFPYLMLWASY
jgi:hypothetical protein